MEEKERENCSSIGKKDVILFNLFAGWSCEREERFCGSFSGRKGKADGSNDSFPFLLPFKMNLF